MIFCYQNEASEISFATDNIEEFRAFLHRHRNLGAHTLSAFHKGDKKHIFRLSAGSIVSSNDVVSIIDGWAKLEAK